MEKTILVFHKRLCEVGTEMDWELTMNVDPRSSNGINISHLVCLSGCFTSLLPIPRPFLVHYYRFPMFMFMLCYPQIAILIDLLSRRGFRDRGRCRQECLLWGS
jgi:hypothetical protein